jgi:4-amino-4-deoxy-L-arabinose transferase-like glycosyltransferase
MTIKKKLSSARKWLSAHWRGVIVGIVITALALLTLSLQITTLVDGQNQYETATLKHLESFPNPLDRMINAPYLIPAYIVGHSLDNMLIGARIVSVAFSLLATWALFVLLKRWFSVQVAAVGSLLFITSSWVLAISHQATPFIMLVLCPLLLIASLTRFVNNKNHSFVSFLLMIGALALSAYIPYMFWPMLVVILAMSILYRDRLLKLNKKQLIISAVVYTALLLPLFISLTQYPGQLKEFIGFPETLPTVNQYLTNFVWQFSTIFVYSEPFPELYVGRYPLLDIFSVAMVLLGVYHFIHHMPRRRLISFGFLFIVLALIIPLSNPYQIPMTAFIAIIYVLIASGVYELLRQWFSYFPRNPFARNGAVVLVAIIIGLATLYNLQRFYVAWPNAPETKAVYVVQSNK